GSAVFLFPDFARGVPTRCYNTTGRRKWYGISYVKTLTPTSIRITSLSCNPPLTQKCPDLHQGIFGIVVNLPVNYVINKRNRFELVSRKIHNSVSGDKCLENTSYRPKGFKEDSALLGPPILFIVFIIFRISLNCLSN